MSTFISVLKESFSNTKLNTYLLFLLLILTLITGIPFLNFQSLLAPLNLESYSIIIWISENEDTIFSLFTAFLYLESFLIIFTLITWRFGTYFYILKPLTDFFILTGTNFLLLFLLANNFGILHHNILTIPAYFFISTNFFSQTLALFGYSINILLTFFVMVGLFYKSKK